MLRRAILLVSAGCCLVGCAGRGTEDLAPVGAELDLIFDDPAFHNAQWGVFVQSVETGKILYRVNADKLFMPGSNLKLVTAAVALARLGPGYRFHTRVAAAGAVGDGGALEGDLVVIGGGDPSISERFHGGDPLAVFHAWADSLRALGIERIDGDVVGDDDLYDDVHLGPGWSWDDLGYYYAAEIGALLYNEGALRARVTPGDSTGSPAHILLDPPTDYISIRNDVVTVGDSTGIQIGSAVRPFSNDARLWGKIWIGEDSINRFLAPHNPTLFFVSVLEETLEQDDVAVGGRAVDIDSLPAHDDSLTTLFVHTSPPLSEIIRPFLKRSQNQIGEMLLRQLGVVDSDTGSVVAGRRVVERTLTSWGIPESYYVYVDGSGLSRYNYLSPEAIVRILRVMARRPEFEAYYDALPIAGVDGTLERRMRGSSAEENARAKTGFISNARSLSGYVTTKNGELLAFSIIANNFDAPVQAVEYLQDLAVERLANFAGGNEP